MSIFHIKATEALLHAQSRMLRLGCQEGDTPKLPMVLISAMPVAAPGPCRKVAGQMATTARSPVHFSEPGEGMLDASGRLPWC